ncbi:MAG: thioredoxin family protein [Acholeplasmataceae bacterium]|jgi:small redox-active disulfide protein 2|nr:thioredoxin family protein [Acholeplasmataceae bacterium]
MEIKVLGSGCSNCKRLYEYTKQAVDELDITANIVYVTDMIEIAKANLLRTPGLIINNHVVSYGRVPLVDEIKEMIKKA